MMAVEPEYFKADVPAGNSGKWTLEHFTVPVPSASQRDPRPDWLKSPPGSYTRLRHGDRVFMTDLYDEWWTQKLAMEEACRRGGDVLITGLGLGLVVESMLRSPASPVERVTVVEASAEVIELVGPHLMARLGRRLNIVRASAFTWDPPGGARYSVGWHDIWDNPQDASVEDEMRALEERYASVCDWQGSWPREYLTAVETSTQELGGW